MFTQSNVMSIYKPTSFLICLLTLMFASCNGDIPLPDLDPNSPAGGEILIFEIGDLIPFVIPDNNDIPDQFSGLTRTYDVNDDGVIDIRVRGSVSPGILGPSGSAMNLVFNGEYVWNQLNLFPELGYPLFLPANSFVNGSVVSGVWNSPNQARPMASEGYSEGIAGDVFLSANFPAGVSYVATRTNIGGEYYYGWIEFIGSDTEDADPNEFVIINRFGISQTPELRIRMGEG